MPLEPIDRLIRHAAREGYAVGYFESWNLASLQGVVDAAEEASAPVILGFNGDFLSRPRQADERLAWYAALGLAAAQSSTVPCGLIFNECPRDDWVRQAILAGFNLVMLADPEAPWRSWKSASLSSHAWRTRTGSPSRARSASFRWERLASLRMLIHAVVM